jgi:hypothetical protein
MVGSKSKMFRVTQNGFDLQAVLLMCWMNHVEHQGNKLFRRAGA